MTLYLPKNYSKNKIVEKSMIWYDYRKDENSSNVDMYIHDV